MDVRARRARAPERGDARDGDARAEAPYAYYSEPALSTLLAEYAALLPPGSAFTLPVGALKALGALRGLGGGALVVLVARKGHNDAASQLFGAGEPVVSLHGSLSLMVNLDAVGRYLRIIDADGAAGADTDARARSFALHSPPRVAHLDLALLGVGVAPRAARRARAAFDATLCGFGLTELFVLRDHIEDAADAAAAARGGGGGGGGATLPLGAALALARLSCWDPDVLWQLGEARRRASAAAAAPGRRGRRRARARAADRAAAGRGLGGRCDRERALARTCARSLARFATWYLPYFDRDRTIAAAYDRRARAIELPPLAETVPRARRSPRATGRGIAGGHGAL